MATDIISLLFCFYEPLLVQSSRTWGLIGEIVAFPLWCSGLRIQLQRLELLGRRGFSPWRRNFHMLWVQPKKKQTRVSHTGQVLHVPSSSGDICKVLLFFLLRLLFYPYQLKYSWFTMLCQFLLRSKVTQLYILMYGLFF